MKQLSWVLVILAFINVFQVALANEDDSYNSEEYVDQGNTVQEEVVEEVPPPPPPMDEVPPPQDYSESEVYDE